MYVIAPECKQLFFRTVKHIEFRAKQRVFAGNFTTLLYQKKSVAETYRIFIET